MRRLIFFLCLLVFSTTIVAAQQYDLVIEGGRVIDPETGLDAVRNVGIRDGKIVRVSTEALSGRRVVHAGGLVVAPGFIDLHQHGQDMASQRVKALDGVTTALELEIGAPDVAQFLKSKEGHSLIHYGTSASHVAARAAVFGAPLPAEIIGDRVVRLRFCRRAGPRPISLPRRNRSKLSSSACGRSLMPAAWRLGWAFNTRRERRGWK